MGSLTKNFHRATFDTKTLLKLRPWVWYKDIEVYFIHVLSVSCCISIFVLLQKADFEIYSEYCNNHPKACARLLELQKEKEFRLFFEVS